MAEADSSRVSELTSFVAGLNSQSMDLSTDPLMRVKDEVNRGAGATAQDQVSGKTHSTLRDSRQNIADRAELAGRA